MRRSIIICLIVFTALSFLFQPVAIGKIKLITFFDDTSYYSPVIHNEQVAFYGGPSADVFLWKGQGFEDLSHGYLDNHRSPKIHSGRVVWVSDNRDYEDVHNVFYYDGSIVHQLTHNDAHGHQFFISDKIVIWKTINNEIKYIEVHDWDSKSIETLQYEDQIQTHEIQLKDIDGYNIVMCQTTEDTGEKYHELVAYNLGNNSNKIFSHDVNGCEEYLSSKIDGYNIVWTDHNLLLPTKPVNLFYYNMLNSEFKNLSGAYGAYDDRSPYLDNYQVVWMRKRSSSSLSRDIYHWNAIHDIEKRITNTAEYKRLWGFHNGEILWTTTTSHTNILLYNNFADSISEIKKDGYSFAPNCDLHNGDVVFGCQESGSYQYRICLYDDFDDSDVDGIDDDIDKEPEIPSDYFDDNKTDIGVTSGKIIDRTCYPMIMDADGDDEGVVVEGIGCKSPYESVIWACDNAYVSNISSDYKFLVTCGSANISVLDGSVKTTLEGTNGQTATATLVAGNTLMFDEIDFSLACPTTNTVPIIATIAQRTITLDPGLSLPVFAQENAAVNIDPDTLNRKSKGKWITAYIEPPQGHNANDINGLTMFLEGGLPVDNFSIEGNTFVAKFDRELLIEKLNENNISTPTVINLQVEYQNNAGTIFSGQDAITVNK